MVYEKCGVFGHFYFNLKDNTFTKDTRKNPSAQKGLNVADLICKEQFVREGTAGQVQGLSLALCSWIIPRRDQGLYVVPGIKLGQPYER